MSTLTIEINGEQFDGFVSASVFTTLDTISGQFTFTATNPPKDFPLVVGAEAIIRADSEIVLTGFLEKVSFTNSVDNRQIQIEGRDKTADLIDSTLNGKLEIQNDISLKSLIENTLSFAGIPGINVIDSVGNIPLFTKQDIQSSEAGQGIFEYLVARARKKQVFLITDGIGNIVISRSNGVNVSEILVSQSGNTRSNILESSRKSDGTQRFKTYEIKSQDNAAGGMNLFGNAGGSIDSKKSVDRDGIAQDAENIRTSRKMTIISDSSYTDTECEDRAKWEANQRRVDSNVYSATVNGFSRSRNSGIWKPNQIVQIVDDFCKINDTLLINSVEFSLSETGSKSRIEFVDKDAYEVQASKPIADKKTEGLGNLFGG